MNTTATIKVPRRPASRWMAADASATAAMISMKPGRSGQNRSEVYAPISGPAIRSVSKAPSRA